jgi:cell division protein FtsN
MKKIFWVAIVLAFVSVACKNKKEKQDTEAVNKEVTTPAMPDTLAQAVAQPEPEPEPKPEPDKYFLIAGSFVNPSNAEAFQKQLSEKGFNAQVITRDWGINSEFYKVSYMGFKDKHEAISKMKEERQQPGKEDVWVLVKK